MTQLLNYYSDTTGEFLGRGVPKRDPLEGKPLVPAYSTLIEVALFGDNEIAVFDGEQWHVKPDFRGWKGYNLAGELQEINEIGQTPDPEWTLDRPFILAEAQEIKKNEVRTDFLLSEQTPVNGYNGGFDSAIKLDAAMRLAETAGQTDVTFFDVLNQPHVLTLAEAKAVVLAVAGTYQVLLAKKQTLFSAISSADTQEQLDGVSW